MSTPLSVKEFKSLLWRLGPLGEFDQILAAYETSQMSLLEAERTVGDLRWLLSKQPNKNVEKVDQPTEPGYYWAKYKLWPNEPSKEALEIVNFDGGWVVRCGEDDGSFHVWNFTDWRGPIKPPEEEK